MISAILFIVIALFLCACALLAILGVGQLALSAADAIERDGLARGRAAPAWSLTDSAGLLRHSPPATALQLIIFADHSLKSFPSVAAGLRELRNSAPGALAGLEVVVMLRGPNELAEPVLGQLGLAGIPVITGSPARYASYNVRVMPFAIFVDPAGLVRASSLVNHDWQVRKLGQIAAIPLTPDEQGQTGTAARAFRPVRPRGMRLARTEQPAPAPRHAGPSGIAV